MSETPAAAAAEGAGDDDGFAALRALCERLEGFGAEVGVEWVDGFIAALVCGPRTVTPDEWLPVLFGDAFERAFADPEDVQRALGALMARWNAVATMLMPETLAEDEGRLHYSPLMLEWSDDERQQALAEGAVAPEQAWLLQTGGDWARGFLEAVDAFADDWAGARMNRDEREWLASRLAAIEVLDADPAAALTLAYLRREYGEHVPTRDELIDEACLAVQDLRLLWLEHAARPAPRQVPKGPGRNDPCPCGSGRKFKKCCGAAAG